jgi:hypothetical protein
MSRVRLPNQSSDIFHRPKSQPFMWLSATSGGAWHGSRRLIEVRDSWLPPLQLTFLSNRSTQILVPVTSFGGSGCGLANAALILRTRHHIGNGERRLALLSPCAKAEGLQGLAIAGPDDAQPFRKPVR